jgi:riboflavin biosynthesis pyrimidine reductase
LTVPTKIHWQLNRETRYPFGEQSPDPESFEPIGFPPPWPDRPWIYGVMVASKNGVVAWKRADEHDDPVLAILGGDDARPERIADRRHMRHLRCYGDVALGAQTLRDQPRLVPTPQEPGEPPAPALYAFREAHGLSHQPRVVVYSRSGRLDPSLAVFNTPGIDVLVTAATIAAHRRLFAESAVRYLACEGGATILRLLNDAKLLDEVFVTVTDAEIDESKHDGVLRIFDFAREGATLVAEGNTSDASAWRFRRWRFNAR